MSYLELAGLQKRYGNKLDPDGKGASRVQVELGRSSVNAIEIVKGLNEGDSVILSDMSRFETADRVRFE